MSFIERVKKFDVCLCLIILLGLFGCSEEKTTIKQQIIKNWRFYFPDSSRFFVATVPGTIHTDLLNNNLIENPFDGCNEDSLQWIGNEQWVYKSKFVVDPDVLYSHNVFLVFEGLVTYADVLLNDNYHLRTENMFRRYEWDVTDKLKKDTNFIEVIFYPADTINQYKASRYYAALPDERAFSRKAPYHFGWDWGPKFLTCGIWKPVYLEAWDDLKINSVLLNQDLVSDSLAKLTARIEIISDTNLLADVKLDIQGKSGTEIKKQVLINPGINLVRIKFGIDDPKLWWTHDLGEPYLYDVKVSVGTDKKTSDTKYFKTGLRQIELVTEADSIGESFYFRLNGVPLFIKGANYIPQDVFLANVEMEDYKNIINSAVDANMNMLRVWGGGVYERDVFYDLCDRHGLLVWQDFMFACNMYPGDSSFIKNVEEEITSLSSNIVKNIKANEFIGNQSPEDVFLHAEYVTNGNRRIAANNYFFVKPKELSLPASQLEISVVEYRKGYQLRLISDVMEKNVFLYIDKNGRFSDNFFDLLPEKEKIIYFEAENEIEKFKERIVVFSLNKY